jgi:hypothetical protein
MGTVVKKEVDYRAAKRRTAGPSPSLRDDSA